MKNTLLALAVGLACFGTALGQSPKHAETVTLNALDTYYEVYGEGPPLFFLHGWTGSSAAWHEYLPQYTNNFEVYLVDLFGHGKSSPIKGEFSMIDAAHQFGALLDHLELEQVSAVGLSYGAELLLQYASNHSNRIKSMVVIGGTYNYPRRELNWNFEDVSAERLDWLKSIHIHGEDQIRAFYDQVDNYEILLTEEDLAGISSSTLIVVGERETWFELDVPLKMHQLIPDSHLWIVPNKGHVAISGSSKPEFVRISTEFLQGKWE